MQAFDYGTAAVLCPRVPEAELFLTKRRRMRQPVGYGRFARAADAIRFAIEELQPELLSTAQLEVSGERFDGQAIRQLYERAEYPLARRAARR
jgi:Arc/MetJ-type ribon-helix-helix transcriptional regulator